ncbi:MAG: gamma-glutamyltransferase [Labilithrix sp.]|nr:gamma-glutamyltransferase [Labilithrix sp.]
MSRGAVRESSRPPGSTGVVAAGDPQTAEAGADLLREGGNAIDAAVAAAFAAFVCELPLCSPLGGGVCVVERGGDAPVAFDLFARTPGLGLRPGTAARDFAAVTVDFGAATQVFHVGRASVAVPLALTGLLELHRRWGARPLASVLAPAIALGRGGYTLGPGVAFVFDILRPIVERTDACRRLFVDEAGAIATAGARLANPDLASTLEALARRPEAVVREIYDVLAREMGPDQGGLITPDDVAAAAIAEHAPVVVDHGDWRLATMPSPSTGGVLVALGLRLLEGAGRAPRLSREHMLLVAKAQEAMLAERDETFAERCADPALVAALLDDERLAIARAHARNNLLGSTTQISAIDRDGTAVSLTLTNGEGSGHVLPGTGMITNNLLGEEDLHPRGFHRDPPGTPIATMMAPTLLSRGGDRIALGSGGSNRLRTAILQVLVGLVEHRVSAADAVHAPRLHLEIDAATKKPRIAFEAAGLADDVVRALESRYPPSPAVFAAPNLYFGGVHLAMRVAGELDGIGDARRGGARVVV